MLFSSCSPEKPETATKGHLHVFIPESVAPAILEQVREFLIIYGKNGAEVSYTITTTEEAITRFLHDTTRLIFSTRKLTEEERVIAKRKTGVVIEIPVAYDALVAVVHFKNPLERIMTPELKGILTGSLTRWEQLSQAKGMQGTITIYVQDSSDVSEYLQRRILRGSAMRQRFRRMSSSLQTLQAVVQDPSSIGFVGLDWIDSAKVPAKVLEIAEPDEQADTTFRPPIETVGKFYPPHPANIYRNYYPLKRAIYLYTTSQRGDVASGFGSFVANKEGQRIFLKRGLVPGTQPIRLKPLE
ncbi:MAG TPA: substrate-binding domain-containing protein [Bacteroidota bacterium]|nr:substrate-binding domain-containing protein [Bacteroidota bacterium]